MPKPITAGAGLSISAARADHVHGTIQVSPWVRDIRQPSLDYLNGYFRLPSLSAATIEGFRVQKSEGTRLLPHVICLVETHARGLQEDAFYQDIVSKYGP